MYLYISLLQQDTTLDLKTEAEKVQKNKLFEIISNSLPRKQILQQSTEAVSFLHGLERIHRNLHPNNFLIFCVDPIRDYFIIKLTDFQLSRDIKEDAQNTGTLNKKGWVAPESFIPKLELTDRVDCFILGLYYFYVFSGGKHPFGKGVDDQRTRIKAKNDQVYQDSWDGKPNWPISDLDGVSLLHI